MTLIFELKMNDTRLYIPENPDIETLVVIIRWVITEMWHSHFLVTDILNMQINLLTAGADYIRFFIFY